RDFSRRTARALAGAGRPPLPPPPAAAADGAGARVGAAGRHGRVRLLEQPVFAVGRCAWAASRGLVLLRLAALGYAAGVGSPRPRLEGRLYRCHSTGRAGVGAAGPHGAVGEPGARLLPPDLAAGPARFARRRGLDPRAGSALVRVYDRVAG